MAKLKKPPKVKFFVGLIFNEEKILENVVPLLKKKFGEIEIESDIFPFIHTEYYEKEMGKDLKRKFLSFKPLYEPDKIVEFKLYAIEIEEKFKEDDRRKVNIDPGYVELSKVVLSTTKNYSHRVYLGKGVYAEVTLYFKGGNFKEFHYTYPDYRTEEYKEFFKKVRECLKKDIG